MDVVNAWSFFCALTIYTFLARRSRSKWHPEFLLKCNFSLLPFSWQSDAFKWLDSTDISCSIVSSWNSGSCEIVSSWILELVTGTCFSSPSWQMRSFKLLSKKSHKNCLLLDLKIPICTGFFPWENVARRACQLTALWCGRFYQSPCMYINKKYYVVRNASWASSWNT